MYFRGDVKGAGKRKESIERTVDEIEVGWSRFRGQSHYHTQ